MRPIDADVIRLPKGFFEEVDNVPKFYEWLSEQPTIDTMKKMLTQNEAYAVAEFIDTYIFDSIRNDLDWDSFQALRNLVHAYEKCCEISGYAGLTDSEGRDEYE